MNQDKILKKMYNEDTDMFTKSPIKFGICIATFQRPSGRSPKCLIDTFNCILKQTASNWHIYLVGDKYENNEEFEKLVQLFPYQHKLTYINLPHAVERENVKHPFELWKIAGCNAFNTSNKMALEDGCDYLLHYDDDDIWHPKKIQILNYICSIYNNPLFVYHYSTHTNPPLIPRETITELGKNNLLPRSCNVIHSSCCSHRNLIEHFKYEGYVPGKERYECGDQQFYNFINEYMNKNKDTFSVFIPLLLSQHETEGVK